MEFRFRRKVDSASAGNDLSGFAAGLSAQQDQRQNTQSRRGLAAGGWSDLAQGLKGAGRRQRHSGIFAAIHRLDAALDEATRQELAGWIRDQYSTEYGDIPLGFVAQCYLGPPYVDHRLDLIFSIVEHYSPGDVMPDPFAKARMMVRTGGYEFIEVYASGQLVPVLADGSAVSS